MVYAITSHIQRACYAPHFIWYQFSLPNRMHWTQLFMDARYGHPTNTSYCFSALSVRQCTCWSKGLPCRKFCRCHQDPVENTVLPLARTQQVTFESYTIAINSWYTPSIRNSVNWWIWPLYTFYLYWTVGHWPNNALEKKSSVVSRLVLKNNITNWLRWSCWWENTFVLQFLLAHYWDNRLINEASSSVPFVEEGITVNSDFTDTNITC